MRRIKAFTMAELTICIMIIMILAIFAVVNIKPNDDKAKLFIYKAMDNLTLVLDTITSEKELAKEDTDKLDSTDYDWLCVKVADFFSLKNDANCARTSAGDNTVNLTFANGVTVQGLAAAWESEGEEADAIKHKDIVIDIDGPNKGMNKVGMDRFPMRIYANGNTQAGKLIPATCNNGSGNDYCDSGTTVDLAAANDLISYDVYQQANTDSKTANMKYSVKSFKEADCGVFGGQGYFDVAACRNVGATAYKIFPDCLNKEMCKDEYNTLFPDGVSSVDACNTKTYEINPGCIMLLHKPNVAGGILVDTVVNAIDE